ncbi:MAG: hypothetical protein KDB07_04490 [Planctomycetes bacterium]|nr:hypothetical protein [Planctomycetota bacterium]
MSNQGNNPDPRVLRRFVFTIVGVCAISLVLIAGTNIVVDPYGDREIGAYPALQRNSRQIKLELIGNHQDVDTLILGSSRVMQFFPEDVDEVTQGVAFNAGVNSGNFFDAEALYRYWTEKEKRRFRRVILGIDLESFSPMVGIDQRLQDVDELMAFVPSDIGGARKGSDARFFVDLSLDKTKRSIEVLRYEYIKGWPDEKLQFRDDGTVAYLAVEEEIERGVFDLSVKIKKSKEEYRGRFHGFSRLAAHAKQTLTRFTESLRHDGVELVAFLTPLHPEVIEALGQEHYQERLGDANAFLKDLADQHGFHYFDASELSSFGGDPSGFVDGAHITRANAKLILKKLFESR